MPHKRAVGWAVARAHLHLVIHTPKTRLTLDICSPFTQEMETGQPGLKNKTVRKGPGKMT